MPQNYTPANEDVQTQRLYSPQPSDGINYDKWSGYLVNFSWWVERAPFSIEGNNIKQLGILRKSAPDWSRRQEAADRQSGLVLGVSHGDGGGEDGLDELIS